MKNYNKKWTGGVLLAGVTLVGLSASAQDVESLDNGAATPPPAETTKESQGRLPITVSASASTQTQSDIDRSGAGSMSLNRYKAGVMVPVRMGETAQLATTVRYQLDSYNFNDIDPASAQYSWGDVNTLSGSSILQWKSDDKWGYFVGGLIKSSAEDSEGFDDSTTYGGVAGVTHQCSEDLSVGLGLAAMTQIERNVRMLPLVTMKWKIADHWRWDIGLTDVATVGYGTELKWNFSDAVDIGFGLQAHNSRFRITGNAATNTDGGVGQESSKIVYVNTTWHANSNLDLGAFLGVAVGGYLRVDDSDGHKQFDDDYDPAAVLGLKASLRF